MSFYCPKPNCAIHQKGKPFPSMMDCPMCDTPLELQISFTVDEDAIINKYPYVIAYPFERMLLEEDGRNKLELLAYTFLNGLKLWGLVLASEYFRSQLKSAKINELFRSNLYQPSFGNWNSFLRDSIAVMDKENIQLLFPEFLVAYKDVETSKNARKYKAESPYTNDEGQTAWRKTELTAIGTLINFRNRHLGHGLPLSKLEYSELYKEIYPILCDFLRALHFTTDLQLLRHEGAETYSLQGKKVTIVTDADANPSKDGVIVLIDNQGRQLNLLPFYILPKQFISGADQRAEIMVYEQNTGSRVVFFSPESIKAEESGQVLERIQLLIQEKEKVAPCAPENFTTAYINQGTLEHNEKTFAGLKREKKILEGIYQNRIEAENVLCTWFEAASSLLAVSAEAGSGKTNLLAHMQTRYEQLGFTSLFIRAARCQTEEWEEVLKSVWNVPQAIELKEFIAIHYNAKSPIMVLVDGGNEHPAPSAFLHSLCSFLMALPPGSMKVVLSWRGASVTEMPIIPAELEPHVFPAAERDENGLLSKYALRLTGMNKIELEGAWKKYASDKNLRCKPNFEFGDLLLFDASLVEELRNPLLLRLFMELFHGKGMPKAAKGFINLWAVWWNKIKEQPEEAAYLKNLSQLLLEREQFQLSLDDLFEHPMLGAAVKNIQIDSPHQQLLRKGVISQYFMEDALQVSFTMEAALYFVAALNVNANKLASLPYKKPMWKEVARFFIWQSAASGQSADLFDWIDNESIPVEILIKGLAESLIVNGATTTLQQLLDSPSARDYEILEKSIDLLAENRPGEKEQRATELLSELLLHTDLHGRGLKIRLMNDAGKPIADKAFNELNVEISDFSWRELLSWAKYLSRFGQHRNAESVLSQALNLANNESFSARENIIEERINIARKLGKYKESLQFIADWEKELKKINALTDIKQAKINLALGKSLERLSRYQEAIQSYSKAYDVFEKRLGLYSQFTLDSNINIADVKNDLGQYDNALNTYLECLKTYKKVFGESDPNVASTLLRIGDIWETKGQHDKALDYFENSLKIYIEYYGESHPNVAKTLLRIGDIWETKGQYDKALDYFENSLKIYIEYYGECHSNVASTLLRFGDIWKTKGQYDKALDHFENSLKIYIEYYGEYHPNVASALLRFGDIWKTKGQYDKALDYFENSLKIYIEYYGESHPNVASTLTRLGDIWETKGQYDKALEYYEKDIKISIEYDGESHPNVAATLLRIGGIWETKGQYDKALEYYEKDLKISIEYYGESHPEVTTTLLRIGGIWETKGQYDKALEYYEKDLKISIEYYGESHPEVSTTLLRIGGIWETKGQYDKALEYYEKDLKISKEYYSEFHPNVAATLLQIGDIRETKGQYDKALEYFENVLKIRLDYYGESHPKVASILFRIGGIWMTKGHYNKALEYFDSVLPVFIEHYGINHRNIAAIRRNRARVLMGLNRFDEAKKMLSLAIQTLRETELENDSMLARTLLRLAQWQRLTGKTKEAIKTMDESLSIFHINPGEQHVDTAEAYFEKAILAEAIGNTQSAKEFFQKCYDIRCTLLGSEHPDTLGVLEKLNNIY
jgi:tetratricopeptide (TPR) repeat protein